MRRNSIFVSAGVSVLILSYVLVQFLVPVRLNEAVEVHIKRGMSFKEAVTILSAKGLVRDGNLFLFLGRISGLHKRLIPGYYSFLGSVSAWDVFGALRSGRVAMSTVTIVEGDSLLEIKKKLLGGGVMTEGEFEGLVKKEEFLKGLYISAPSLEGYLFPDTYSFPKGLEPDEVFGLMVKRLREVFGEGLRRRADALGLSEREVLTLASIIEKEAFMDEERPLVSAVYHNRLKRGMPLQADPTVVYGIKPQSKGITKNDLKAKTPYNTYIIKGLPPGPIASPGLKSIRAALYPADVPFFYFVSNYNGTHVFSATAGEHLKAVGESRIKKEELKKEKANEN